MDLAKQCVDVGLYTSALDDVRAFYEGEVGLAYEELLPVGGGVHQHRLGLNGSVLKVNQNRNPLADAPTGYRWLAVATAGEPRVLRDPDGLEVRLVRPGEDGVTAIAIGIAARDPDAYARFYETLGASDEGGGRDPIGTTLVCVSPRSGRGAGGADGCARLPLHDHPGARRPLRARARNLARCRRPDRAAEAGRGRDDLVHSRPRRQLDRALAARVAYRTAAVFLTALFARAGPVWRMVAGGSSARSSSVMPDAISPTSSTSSGSAT